MAGFKVRLIGLALTVLLVATGYSVESVGGEEHRLSTVTFYFYGNRLMHQSENRSIFAFDRADVYPPGGEEAVVVEFASELHRVVEGVPGWVGGVCWGSRRLLNDTRIAGTASFRFWLSSEEWLWIWEFSGIGVGIAEVDRNGRVVWGPFYRYRYAIGNILPSSPKEYSLTLEVDHVFRAGNHILFGVAAGSTRQGWRVKAYFGNASFPSRVAVPFIVSGVK